MKSDSWPWAFDWFHSFNSVKVQQKVASGSSGIRAGPSQQTSVANCHCLHLAMKELQPNFSGRKNPGPSRKPVQVVQTPTPTGSCGVQSLFCNQCAQSEIRNYGGHGDLNWFWSIRPDCQSNITFLPGALSNRLPDSNPFRWLIIMYSSCSHLPRLRDTCGTRPSPCRPRSGHLAVATRITRGRFEFMYVNVRPISVHQKVYIYNI